jgi:hypothetical protein
MFVLVILATLLPAPAQSNPADAVLQRLVFGCHIVAVAGAAAEHDADVAARLRDVDERCRAFAARRPPPRADSLDGMVANARWSYEQRLFAIAAGSVETETGRYVTALRPCYEWEGFHDCPEREAAFADRYLKEHPSSVFAPYLPLLAAHRWLCAAEAYEYEMTAGVPASKTGVGLTQARVAYADRVQQALRSQDSLVRFAAERLEERGSCF